MATAKILVIDDDELVRLTCRNILTKAGYHVLEAENGNSGLAVFQDQNPDLVITDMLMPDKEGLETIVDIRAINPRTGIIAISGGGSTHNLAFLQLARKVGANRALKKPIKPAELLAAVEDVLTGR